MGHRRSRKLDLLSIGEWPPVIYLWGFAMAFLGYLVVELISHLKSHPIHWLTALGGGLVGVVIGWFWFRWRGDVP